LALEDGLLSLTFDEAWRAYRRSELLLPAKPPPVSPRRIGHIGEIASGFDLIALDAWGVLTLGEQAIATAPAAVARLRAMGKRLVVLSNGGSRDSPALAARLRGFGFPMAPEEVINGLGFHRGHPGAALAHAADRAHRRLAGATSVAHPGHAAAGR
jgi:hypothetical protein